MERPSLLDITRQIFAEQSKALNAVSSPNVKAIETTNLPWPCCLVLGCLKRLVEIEISVGDKLAVITTDPFMEQVSDSVLILENPEGRKRINRAVWPLNQIIVSGGEDAVLRIWDAETGKLLKETDKEVGHKQTITSLCKSADDSHFLIGSLGKTAKACVPPLFSFSLVSKLCDMRTYQS
ncbi:hypothetical protein Bca101_082174 [Brassica carinata]